MEVEPQQLKAFLMDANLVTEEEFEQAKEQAKNSEQGVGDILVSKDLISEERLLKLNAYILGVPFVDLEDRQIDPEVLKIIPEPIARSHDVIAFDKEGDELQVAMLDPRDLKTIEFIKKKAGLKIKPRLTTPESIKTALRQYQESLKAEFGDIIQEEAEQIKPIEKEEEKKEHEEERLKEVAQEVSVVRIVDTLINHAIMQRASDIHIEPTEKNVIVRYRIDGVLHDAMTLPKETADGIVARIKVLADLKLDEHRRPQDGRFKIEREDYRYSVRVSILPVYAGEKVVMRLLPEQTKGFTLESLGLRDEALENVHVNLKKPVGMILVTGPTGSGKTTTLYTMMEILETPQVNISTIEDPIEYRMPRINQTQVNRDVGLNFATGLRALVRQDPDIIMVGEIRDNETASLATNAALTGHLVLSTLHTTNAAGAVPRLIDMGVKPFLISSTLNVVVAQRLVRELDDPKEAYTLDEERVEDLRNYCDVDRILEILKDKGIAQPNDSFGDVEFYRPEEEGNYEGRVGIFEVLPVNETIKQMVTAEATTDEIYHQAQSEGMRTMIEDGFIKAAQGLTTIEEILRVTME
ncbi:MAG: GspE/PulE family protein [Candidatus Paceibacterota bacterium]